MTKRAKIVQTSYGVGKRIAAALNVSVQSVSYALCGKLDNELGDKIRRVAIKEYGGIPVTFYDDFVANCDTVRETNGDMVSLYNDRVKVIYSESQNRAGVFIDGELKETAQVRSIADYMEFEKRVQGVVDSLR